MKKTKKIFALILTLALALTSATGVAFASDVDYSKWNSGTAYPSDIVNTQYFTAVRVLMDKGFITGDSDGLFHPEKNITRAEFATIMAKATHNVSNLDKAAKMNKFSDLAGYEWATSYINAAADAGLIQGVGNGKYEPGRNVTYAEAFTVIIRSTTTSYNQIIGIGTWPQNIIKHVQTYNLAGDTTISDWNAAATRGNIAKLLYRNMPKTSTTATKVTISTTTISAAAGATTISVVSSLQGVNTTYQWYKNDKAITSKGTSSSLSIAAPLTKGDRYYVKVTTTKLGYNPTSITSGTCTVVD